MDNGSQIILEITDSDEDSADLNLVVRLHVHYQQLSHPQMLFNFTSLAAIILYFTVGLTNKVILIPLTDHASFEKSDKLLYHLCTSLEPIQLVNNRGCHLVCKSIST